MIVSRGSNTTSSRGDPDHYMGGRVWRDFLINKPEVRILNVFHEPGARSFWHSHTGGQILFVTAGEGRIANRNGESVALRAGDCVYTPPGEIHWHGASADTVMEELAISIGSVDWPADKIVTDEQYARGFEKKKG